jgi:peptidoglycan/LPS O-acetylase OafA/YrhL
MPEKPELSSLRAKLKNANRKLLAALACYAVLIAIALYVLLPAHTYHERFLLGLVLLVAALFMVKTIAHANDDKME